MKKIIFTTISIIFFTLFMSSAVFAQGMMGTQSAVSSDGHTAREEAEGKEIREKLQAKQLECKNLTEDNYGSLGEYFMGQIAGEQHEAMNNMMIRMMGEDGEKQMHIAMGKRMSGCEPNAPMPQNMPALSGVEGMNGGMMNMMMGGGMMGGGGNSMIGWAFMILFWGLIVLGIIALIRWMANQGKNQTQDKSAVDILKERYAKGEIDKKEFEEKKYDIKNPQ